MFTGIVEEVGHVAAIERQAAAARLEIACRDVVEGTAVGDSIAVAGCCVTVTELTEAGFAVDLMSETLRATALDDLTAGDGVNLERAVAVDDRLGGHLVQGHVDGVGDVVQRDEEPGTVILTLTCPPPLGRYLVPRGSVTIDGASLTVVDVDDSEARTRFSVALIPHTLAVTTLGETSPGGRVNLEVDMIAKYVERLLAAGVSTPYTDREGPT